MACVNQISVCDQYTDVWDVILDTRINKQVYISMVYDLRPRYVCLGAEISQFFENTLLSIDSKTVA